MEKFAVMLKGAVPLLVSVTGRVTGDPTNWPPKGRLWASCTAGAVPVPES